jgi:hypothetical protein
MAEFNSRQITALAASPKVKANPYDGGTTSWLVATTPATAAWAQDDTFVIGTIPKGSRILPTGMVVYGAFGASVTMTVGVRLTDGTVVDADGILTTANVAAAGEKTINNGALARAVGGLIATADWVLYATIGGADPADNTQAEFFIPYLAPTH